MRVSLFPSVLVSFTGFKGLFLSSYVLHKYPTIKLADYRLSQTFKGQDQPRLRPHFISFMRLLFSDPPQTHQNSLAIDYHRLIEHDQVRQPNQWPDYFFSCFSLLTCHTQPLTTTRWNSLGIDYLRLLRGRVSRDTQLLIQMIKQRVVLMPPIGGVWGLSILIIHRARYRVKRNVSAYQHKSQGGGGGPCWT